jgi:two-component system, OmpR family, phosphate regulon sensor histidine kinase PhoR
VARFAAPAAIQLRRAQLILMLAALVPTALLIAVGILLLLLGQGTTAVVAGVLVLAFCTTALTGYILGSIYVSRGAMVARFQHDFLSSVSHELRTPLTSILMFIETLRSERITDPAEQRQCLDLLDQEIRRLNGLVDRLIQLSRLEARRHRFLRQPVKIEDVVHDALIAFDAATLTDRATVDVEVDGGDDLAVQGDRDALAQAVANLLINAWKYSREGDRRISLKTTADRKFVDIAVGDNGPGIPREEQGRIFDHFERGRGAVDGGMEGSGLGLAIVRAIVRGHRGRIELRSVPGVGSEFRLKLRRARAAT